MSATTSNVAETPLTERSPVDTGVVPSVETATPTVPSISATQEKNTEKAEGWYFYVNIYICMKKVVDFIIK